MSHERNGFGINCRCPCTCMHGGTCEWCKTTPPKSRPIGILRRGLFDICKRCGFERQSHPEPVPEPAPCDGFVEADRG
jgi:hypothetical protein